MSTASARLLRSNSSPNLGKRSLYDDKRVVRSPAAQEAQKVQGVVKQRRFSVAGIQGNNDSHEAHRKSIYAQYYAMYGANAEPPEVFFPAPSLPPEPPPETTAQKVGAFVAGLVLLGLFATVIGAAVSFGASMSHINQTTL